MSSHKTAMHRKTASAPVRKLLSMGKINESVLDFGCGHGADYKYLIKNGINAVGFDPYWKNEPNVLNQKYKTILCTYVLNVVSKPIRKNIINQIKNLTKLGGKAYISIGRDIKKDVVSKIGTTQYAVKLPFKIIKQNSSYCIYELSEV